MTGTPSPAAPRRRGRPARRPEGDGTPSTRERILTAARDAFATLGYDRASLRAIARGAEVDAALVHHYFGGKEQVFAAAVAAAAAPALEGIKTIPEDDPDAVGELMVRYFFGLWEDPDTRDPMLAVARSAFTNETAARVFRTFIADQLMRRVADRAGYRGPDARLRVQLAAGQLVGTAMLRYVLRMEPLADTPAEDVIRRLAPVVQRHLTGPAS